MRQTRTGARSENRRQPAALRCEQRVPHRVDALVHSVQTTRSDALTGGVLGNPQPPQLLKRHKPILLVSNTRNLTVHTGSTGLKAIYIFALSPVDGGGGGHGGSVAELSARVVRSGSRVMDARHAKRERPGSCRASLENCTRLLRRGYAQRASYIMPPMSGMPP